MQNFGVVKFYYFPGGIHKNLYQQNTVAIRLAKINTCKNFAIKVFKNYLTCRYNKYGHGQHPHSKTVDIDFE